MPPPGFEPAITAGERPQTLALDRSATGTGMIDNYVALICSLLLPSLPAVAQLVSKFYVSVSCLWFVD